MACVTDALRHDFFVPGSANSSQLHRLRGFEKKQP
jgi:hypothetical protein